MSIENVLNTCSNRTYYAIDIGASTGSGPCYEFLQNNSYSGLAIECNEHSYKTLTNTIKNPNVRLHLGYATPDTICSIFKSYNVPQSPDILKIDIDGYDLCVLRAILQEYSPKIIIAEINEKIPPPIHFEVKYSPSYVWDGSHCFGFSIQAGKSVMDKFNYSIASLYGGNNILCVNDKYIQVMKRSINEIYKQDYYENNNIRIHFPWNEDVHIWNEIPNSDLVKTMIFDYFTKYNPRGKPIPADMFELY
jgi:hypothetical protein